MDRVGLLDNIGTSVTRVYQGRAWLDTEGREGDGRVSYNKGLSLALASFQTVQANAACDLEAVVLLEQAYLAQELAFCTPVDKKAANSLSNGIKSFDEGLLALKEVEAGASYSVADRILPHRKETRCNGMPKDAFHYACAGHLERLDGILHTPGINMTEKAVLEQRLANIETAQSVYVEKQKKALGGVNAAP
ncbi:MAG: hypothetical protein LBR16_03120 [Treponema sp.]|jgi:hypothetical protein|nr:hypothetical protein [Treponema sp.]